MSPGRDIVHAFAGYCEKAFNLLQNPQEPIAQGYTAAGGSEDEVLGYMRCIVALIRGAADPKTYPTLAEAATAAGWFEQPERIRQFAGAAFVSVFTSAYFAGYRECVSGDPLPAKQVDFLEVLANQRRPWWRRTLRRLLFRLYGWL